MPKQKKKKAVRKKAKARRAAKGKMTEPVSKKVIAAFFKTEP